MSGRPIDHIVHLVDNLDHAAASFEAHGFRLTPRARHEDRMGTSNRLAQFRGGNFIELLEVDRPDRLQAHDFDAVPPFFGFGAHNRAQQTFGEGITMLVFASKDARADIAAFARAGIHTYAPFDFARQAIQPDGEAVTVSFSLGFATSPAMPRLAFFVCENRAPEYFWKPAYQEHPNGAESISAIYLGSAVPERDAAFLNTLFDGAVTPHPGGFAVSCGAMQEIRVLAPDAIAALDADIPADSTPVLAGMEIKTAEGAPARAMIPASRAHGAFLTWKA